MNSYPENFLTHPQPLMFVAGLTSSSSRDRSASVISQSGTLSRRPSGSASASASTSRRPSDAAATRRALDPTASGSASTSYLDPSQSSSLNSLTTPLTSPSLNQRHAELPRSPPPLVSPPASGVVVVTSEPEAEPEKQNSAQQDEMDRDFEKLVTDLRGALEAKSGKSKVWLPEKERKDFRILLVDKSIRLPARKATPQTPAHPDQPPQALHSPLSPLTPSSPTYPDGLIAPIWVRKHAELIPSVFVLFLRMWECPNPDSLSPEELQQKERERDDSLVKEIADRRRRLGERGIKLTVVLMASAAALDSPVLDPRLSYLRRASSLSAKASLFVLTPVPADQLPDFVQSLQDALFDSAMEYYAAHGKKVRRKRVRLPSAASGAMTAIPGKTLGSQGWAVRYDFKGAWFAELRGDFVDARRHYEDCWNELAKMFASTQTLPPRTKRWAEAKVLADCVAFRICRLLLYSDDVSKVLTPFHVHLKRFSDLSRGWGIGEDAFEYWSSLSRQYRIFAELLEMAQADNVQLPTLPPPILPTPGSIPSWQSSNQQPSPEYYTTPVSSLNPLQVLQQPAYYYYAAADCTLERRKRYEAARAVQEDAQESEAGGHIALAPGYANETKVDHAGLAIELFTKAYSLLKDQQTGNPRVALYVAFRIAETYCSSSQHDLAMRFFDRISNTFKQDRWSPIVRQIRTLWYQCAQNTGNVESAAKLLLEMMSPKSGVEDEERVSLQDDFLSLLKTTQPSSADPIMITMDEESTLLDVKSAFWLAQADLGEKVPFQLSMTCDTATAISQLRFSTLHIAFTDARPDLVVNAGTGADATSEPFVDLGIIGAEDQELSTPPLTWQPGSRIVLSGQMQGDQEGEIKVESVRLTLSHNTWAFQLVLPVGDQTGWYTPKGAISPIHELSSSVDFVARPIDVTLDTSVGDLGFVGEQITVLVKITNADDRRVHIRLSVFLPPGEDEQDLTATYEGQETTTLLQDIILGYLEPTAAMEKTILVKAIYPGSKLIDFSVQATLEDLDAVDTEEIQRVQEVNHTATLDIVDPFQVSSSVMFRHASRAVGDDGVEGWATVMSVFTMPEAGSRSVKVEGIKVEPKNETVQLLTSSLEQHGADAFPQDWTSSTPFSIISKFALRPSRRPSSAMPGQVTDTPALVAITWRSKPDSEATTTYLPLPTLALPPQDSFITAHLRSPPSCKIGTPTTLSLSITNSHPSATATSLAVTVDPSEHFMWVGPRSVHVTPLRPGETGTLELQVVPTFTGSGVDGRANLPRVRLWEGMDDDREELDVVVLSERGEIVERAGASIQVMP